MQKKFLSNLILILTLNLLVKPFYLLGIETEVQNRVGAEIFGDYFALISFSFLLNVLLDMGISNYNTRTLSRAPTTVKSNFAPLLSLRLVLSLVYVVVIFLCGLLLNYSNAQLQILGVLAVNQILVSGILFMRSNLTGLQLFKKDSLVSILDRLLLIVLMAVLLWTPAGGDGPFQIEWFVYGQTLTYGLTFLVALIIVLQRTGKIRLVLDKAFQWDLLKKSFPYALLIFLMYLAFRTDSVMLERMLPEGKEQAGIYAMGFRYFEAANMIGYLFAVLLLPIFSRMLKTNQNVSDLVQLSGKILLSGALILACLCYVFDEELLALRYVDHVEEAAPIFGLLMLTYISFCSSYIFGSLLTANGSLKALNCIAFGGFVLNIALNLAWIPIHQAWGSAMATLITQSLMALAQIVIAFRVVSIQLDQKFMFRLIAFVLGCIFFSRFVTIIFENWLYNASAFVGASLLWAFLTGMLSLNKFWALVQEK